MEFLLLLALAVAAGILIATNFGTLLGLLAILLALAVVASILVIAAAGVTVPFAFVGSRLAKLSPQARSRLELLARWFLAVTAATLAIWLVSSAIELNVSLGRLSRGQATSWYSVLVGAIVVLAFPSVRARRVPSASQSSIRRPPDWPARSEPELRSGLTHVAYEREALRRACHQFLSQPVGDRLVLESALLHARNPIDFFWAPIGSRRPHANGIYAAHYLDAVDDWKAILNGQSQFPNQRYGALSAQLAHVSVERLSPSAPDFAADLNRLHADLGVVWDRWRKELDSTEWRAPLDAAVLHWDAQ